MPVKIRLQRHGKKGNPFYWVVAIDSKTKRDGMFLEKLGTYNPNTNPASIDLDLNSAVKWLRNGAQPSETARRILSHQGVLLKHHLDKGVTKGALTQEQADAKLQQWLTEKSGKTEAKKELLLKNSTEAKHKQLQSEKEKNEKRSKAILENQKANTVDESASSTSEAKPAESISEENNT